MIKDENVREMRQRKKVKKEEKHADNMKSIGALQLRTEGCIHSSSDSWFGR
jgi:hypothetical protein